MAEDSKRGRSIPHWHSPGETLSIARGDGCRVYDDDGGEYLDFASQLYCVNAGHGHDGIVAAMTEQLGEVQYVSSAKHNPTRTELAERLAERAPGDLSEVFFAVSGSEANETAVQLAREYTDASTVLTRWQSYHGATYGAASLTGDPATRRGMGSHVATTGSGKFLPPMAYNSPFDADTPAELAEQAADHLEFVIRNEGPDDVAAVLMEPVAGSSGAYTAPPGYFERVREICDEYDVLLIVDEVITGFGRCGDWFGIQGEDVEPDLLTFAKGVTGAYAPLAGVLARPEVVEHVYDEGSQLGQTFGGHPVACAAGLGALDAYEDGLIDNVRDLSGHLEASLRSLADDHDVVADVRGRGFHWSVEIADPATGEPFVDPWAEPDADNPVKAVVSEAEDRGVLVGAGRPATQVIISPPLCTGEADLTTGIDALGDAIGAVFD